MDSTVTPFFPFDYPIVTEELIHYFGDHLLVDEQKKEKIEELKTILNQETNFYYPEDNDAFLLQFLRIRKFDVQRAAILCRNFFRKLQECKPLFEDVDIPSLIKKFRECKTLGISSTRDSDGCIVFIIFAGRWDPHLISLREFFQAFLFTVMQCLRSPATQASGFKFICDFSGYSFKQISHVSPSSLWHGLDSMQNCIPFPIKLALCVNENAVFKHLWTVLKLVVKKKITDRCHFLGKNLEGLKETFPADMLPEELGGTAGPFSVEPWLEAMEDFENYFAYIKQYGYNMRKE